MEQLHWRLGRGRADTILVNDDMEGCNLIVKAVLDRLNIETTQHCLNEKGSYQAFNLHGVRQEAGENVVHVTMERSQQIHKPREFPMHHSEDSSEARGDPRVPATSACPWLCNKLPTCPTSMCPSVYLVA